MMLKRWQGMWFIFLSFIVSMMLDILPLPTWVAFWWPDWSALVLIYWCIAVPHRVGIVTGWSVGIFHDLLNDTLLGQQALGLCLITYLCVKWHRRLRFFPPLQQSIFVGGLVAMKNFLVFSSAWIQGLGLVQQIPATWTFLYPAVTSMLLWPWIFVILRDIRRIYQIN